MSSKPQQSRGRQSRGQQSQDQQLSKIIDQYVKQVGPYGSSPSPPRLGVVPFDVHGHGLVVQRPIARGGGASAGVSSPRSSLAGPGVAEPKTPASKGTSSPSSSSSSSSSPSSSKASQGSQKKTSKPLRPQAPVYVPLAFRPAQPRRQRQDKSQSQQK